MLNLSKNISDRIPVQAPVDAKKRVFVGMSGGVDSSVSAYLLKEQGYDVTGVFIKVWQPDSTDCGWKDERRDAMRVAAVLDIPFITLDFSEQYKREVVDYMINEYRVGRTPNPDVMCNRHVKFGSFLKYTLAEGVDYVATGHYAQNIWNKKTNLFEMKEGIDANKDQSYFLWTLTQEDLKHVLFPIGHLEKSEVRRIAEKAGLPVFDKKDSQGVCFIGHLDMKEFLKEHIETHTGNVLDTDGNVIGTHEGAILYTIGERHGFTFNTKTIENEPHFITAKDIEKNTITVAAKSHFENDSNLARTNVAVTSVSCSQNIDEYLNTKISARIRYRQEKQSCIISKNNEQRKEIHSHKGQYIVTFDTPQKGIAEGQSVVLYDGDTCLGGGILNFI
ncbi:MAG: tRNA 2-thiouridine(34) synthase MnmA [Candidatus Pacebacteria bacterium]|nr:tRNA 2-thiouridine(34) synthase MnmA [Candidatus Paceibacterota bacterium]